MPQTSKLTTEYLLSAPEHYYTRLKQTPTDELAVLADKLQDIDVPSGIEPSTHPWQTAPTIGMKPTVDGCVRETAYNGYWELRNDLTYDFPERHGIVGLIVEDTKRDNRDLTPEVFDRIEQFVKNLEDDKYPAKVIITRPIKKGRQQFTSTRVTDIKLGLESEASIRYLLENSLEDNPAACSIILDSLLSFRKEENAAQKCVFTTEGDYSSYNSMYKQLIADLLLLPVTERRISNSTILAQFQETHPRAVHMVKNIAKFQEHLMETFIENPERILSLFENSIEVSRYMLHELLIRNLFTPEFVKKCSGRYERIEQLLQISQDFVGRMVSSPTRDLFAADIDIFLQYYKDTFAFEEDLVQRRILNAESFDELENKQLLIEAIQSKLNYILRSKAEDIFRTIDGKKLHYDFRENPQLSASVLGIKEIVISPYASEIKNDRLIRMEMHLESGETINYFYDAKKEDLNLYIMPRIVTTFISHPDITQLDILAKSILIHLVKEDSDDKPISERIAIANEMGINDTKLEIDHLNPDEIISEGVVDTIDPATAEVTLKKTIVFRTKLGGTYYEITATHNIPDTSVKVRLPEDFEIIHMKKLENTSRKVTGMSFRNATTQKVESYTTNTVDPVSIIWKEVVEAKTKGEMEKVVGRLINKDLIGGIESLLHLLMASKVVNADVESPNDSKK